MSPINYKSVTATGPKILKHTGTINLGSSSGGGNSDKLLISKIAGENITSHKCVIIDNNLAKIYNPLDITHYNRLVGIAYTSALAGDPLQIITTGILTLSVPVTVGAVYYAAANGGLTTTPNSGGLVVDVATGISTSEIMLNIKGSFVLI